MDRRSSIRVDPRDHNEEKKSVILHYPVTTSFWKGVFEYGKKMNRPLRRACDWQTGKWEEMIDLKNAQIDSVICADCESYLRALFKMQIVYVMTRFRKTSVLNTRRHVSVVQLDRTPPCEGARLAVRLCSETPKIYELYMPDGSAREDALLVSEK